MADRKQNVFFDTSFFIRLYKPANFITISTGRKPSRGIVLLVDQSQSPCIPTKRANRFKPTPKDLLGMLLETDPLTACYDCGNIRAVDKLNVLIKGKGLGKCRDLME